MGHLFAIGGILVPCESARTLDEKITRLCARFGFPRGEPFKWSPGREMWMRENLVKKRRKTFLTRLTDLLGDKGIQALVVIEDTQYKTAIPGAQSGEEDVLQLFLERVHNQLHARGEHGVVAIARPGGDRREEDQFLADCFDALRAGTDYVAPSRIASVLTGSAKLYRLFQVADVITSCSLAMVAGEEDYAPPIFEKIRPLLCQDMGRIGGVGLKIHPDFKYVNLYHWLLGDDLQVALRRSSGVDLPMKDRPYSRDPNLE